jgi:hypothetical protein
MQVRHVLVDFDNFILVELAQNDTMMVVESKIELKQLVCALDL